MMNGRDDPRSVLKRAMGLEDNDKLHCGVRSQDVFTRCVIVVQSCGSSAFSGGKKSCVRVDQNGEKSVNQG